MSVVKFLCPNGHQLNAPVDLVGKKGKCPKCGTAFVVPAPVPDEDHETPAPAPTPSPGSSGKLSAEAGGSAPRLDIKLGSGIKPGPGSKSNQNTFVFLCPNGHKLNGPPSLKGKLGQCPHCGAKFRIPEDEPEVVEGAELVDEPPPYTDSVEEISPDQLEIEEPEPPFQEGVHSLAHIVARLWYHKGESGEFELLLPEGEIMQPEYFSPALSANEYGVFATREGHGYSFSVVPWANVRRVNVHKVEHLPPGAFPE